MANELYYKNGDAGTGNQPVAESTITNDKLLEVVGNAIIKDGLANIIALPRVSGNLYYATDVHRLFLDDGTILIEVPVSHVRSVDPTVTDDGDNGFRYSDIWVNTTTKEAFICLDPTTGAAVWSSITKGGAVDSVNGKVGVVVLDGTDLELIDGGGVTITQAISDLDTDIQTRVQSVTAGSNVEVNNSDPINPIVSAFPVTTAGLLDRTYFTGDTETLAAGTFYKSNRDGKGTVATVTQTVTVNDNEKAFFAQDLISIPYQIDTTIYKGSYSGVLNGLVDSSGGEQTFTVEIYKTDLDGNPIASGITGQPIGDLGVQVVAIATSGLIDLQQGNETQFSITAELTENLSLLTTNRIRYHVSAEKVGTVGGAKDISISYGFDHVAHLDVPVQQLTNTVINTDLTEFPTEATQYDINRFLKASGGANVPVQDSTDNPYLTFAVQEGGWKSINGNINLLNDANDFSSSEWVKSNVSVNSNVDVSPSGANDADEIIENSANAAHGFSQTTDPNSQRTQSIYVKYNGTTQYFQMYSGVTVAEYANFDIQNGSIGEQGATNINPRIDSVGNGWFRVSVTLQMAGTCNYQLADSLNTAWAGGYQGNGTDGLLVWFGKVEEGEDVTGGVPLPLDISNETSNFQNRKSLAEYLKKYELKEVDENNQLNIVMIGDSIFGRQDVTDGLALTPNQSIGEFPPNMIYQNIAYNLLTKYQYNNADVEYINLESTKWTKQGTWTKQSNIDNTSVYENNTPSDYLEITVTGCKFFKLVISTMSFKTINGIDITVNGVAPSTLGLTGVDAITNGEADIKWGNYIWSGLDEATSYTFRFTKNSGATSAIWGCETWSKPRLNIINSGFGGFTSTEQAQFVKYAQNSYYKADLIIYEMPVLNDSFGLTSFGGDTVSPTSSRVGGTTENYFVRADSDGTYTNFDNIELKKGELAQIKSGVYVLGSDKYDEFLTKYIDGLDVVLNAQSNLNIPLLCSTVHLTQYIQDNDRFWGVDYLNYSRFKATEKDTAFVDVYKYCVDNEIDPNSITSDLVHINTLGVETWMNVLYSALDLTFDSTNGGAKKEFKEGGYVDAADSRTVTFTLEYKENQKVLISQIGGNNIFIDSIDNKGFTVNGAGSFNWSII